MKKTTIVQILEFLKNGGYSVEYIGNEQLYITSFSNLTNICESSIAWVKNKKYLTQDVLQSIKEKSNTIIVCPWKIDEANNCLLTESPKEVFFSILKEFFSEKKDAVISSKAVIETERIGRNVSIGAGCYISKDVDIDDDVIIHANVVIDCPCKIGRGTEIFSGTVIGADGFGYYFHNDIPERVPHFGGVIIGEYVDIGANTCIDKGTLDDTVIENNVKIDNNCHIGHNVQIGKNTLIVAGTTICGSVVIGDNSYLAPESLIKNQVHIGENSFVGMNTVLSKDIESMAMALDLKQSVQILQNKDYRKFV